MRNKILVGLLFSCLAAPLSSAEKPSPVLVELFTSQGCSSCPPADEVLSTWGRESFERGEVIPLAFHVDYWDHIGWKDPFDAKEYTERQKKYARAFNLGTVYTPQMVMAGRTEFNGSNVRRAKQELVNLQAQTPASQIALDAKLEGARIRVSVSAKSLTPAAGQKKILQAYLAVYENDLETEVMKGENWGKDLKNDFVVRKFKSLGFLALSSPDASQWTEYVPLDPSWARGNLGVAVFLQDPDTMAVDSAAAARL
jgi:hypothetical protein